MSHTIPLHPGVFYHIYNRGNNGENIFIEETNYHYFLQQYTKHVSPCVDTFAFCLLRNHFHLLIRIKEAITDTSVSKAFSNCFNAYARAFNGRYNRHGALFERPFKRKTIETQTYLMQVVYYIHANPIKHGFANTLEEWPFSSYRACVSEMNTHLARTEVLKWFEGTDGYREFHRIMDENRVEKTLILEGEDYT